MTEIALPKRTGIAVLLMSLLTTPFFTTAGETSKPPNIVLIMADDLGYECLGSYGGTSYATPNLDALAEGGMQFMNCHSTPKCSPSRVTIMTGRYTFRTTTKWGHIPKDEVTFGSVLGKAGYKTALAGKWQMGLLKKNPKHVAQMGFQESAVWAWHEGPRYWKPMVYYNDRIMNGIEKRYGPDVFTEFLIEFMKNNKEKQFFAYYPMCLPHRPKKHEPKGPNGKWETYKEMVENMDRKIGDLVQALEDAGLRENTLILFTSDNGSPTGVRSEMGDRIVQGGKAKLTDAGTHVPLIANWPGTTPAGKRCDDLIDFTDFMPTLAELSGAELPDVKIDGTSFAPQLRGQKGTPREWIYTEWLDKGWIRTKQWKLYRDGKLFDMTNDPKEKMPVAQTQATAKIRSRLQSVLNDLKEDRKADRKHSKKAPWEQYAGVPGPSGWRVNVIQPDPNDDGPDGFNFHDWDGDGELDVFVNFEEGGYSRLYFNPGKDQIRNLWTDYIELAKHGKCEDSGIGDLDNDGDIDYIANGGHVYFNPGKEDVRDPRKWIRMTLFEEQARTPVVSDIDGDGLNDLIVGATAWYKQPVTGKHDAANWKRYELGQASWPMTCIVTDMNGNGDNDILVQERRKQGTFYYENPGKDKVTEPWPVKVIDATTGGMFMALGDVNGDGRLDLVKACKKSICIFLRTNDKGTPTYKKVEVNIPDQPKGVSVNPKPKGVAILEMNGDPKHPEIVIIPEYEAQLWYLTMSGNGMSPDDWTNTLMDMPCPESRKKMDNAWLVDLDGDGDMDIATTEENGGWGVIWFENPSTTRAQQENPPDKK